MFERLRTYWTLTLRTRLCEGMGDVTLTADQQRACDYLARRLACGEWQTCLSGYAGTGKTTVVARLIDHLCEQGVSVFAAAPTHKAAQVLRRFIDVPAAPAQTIHSLFGLQLRPDASGGYTLAWDGRTRPPDGSVVVVDEASMIGQALWRHIDAADGVQWVFVGDPAQLPPVKEAPSPALAVTRPSHRLALLV